MSKKRNLFRGLSVSLSFISALLLSGEIIATSSTDYKSMIDGIFGVTNVVSGSSDAYMFKSDFKNTIDLYTKRSEVVKQIAAEGCVLLKNENKALPLRNSIDSTEPLNVTVLGTRAFTFDEKGNQRDAALSFYAGIVGSKIYRQDVTLRDGKIDLPITLEGAFKTAGLNINPECKRIYSGKNFTNLPGGSEANGQQGQPFEINEPVVTKADFKDSDNYNDACFVVIGRSSGEGRDYLPGANGIANKQDGSKSALNLSNNERTLIEEASKISDKVIVLLNSAVAMEINELKEGELASKVDSVMWIGLPGSYGMDGIADVLTGKLSPSGHLPDIYAVDASASPAAQNFGVVAQDNSGSFTWKDPGIYTNADNGHYVVLAEDMYTGYYYYETRYADCIEGKGNASSNIGLGREAKSNSWKYEDEVAYSFGYGMSYSDFETEILPYDDGSELKYNAEENAVEIKVKVTNIGDYPAKKSVQLYASTPYTQYDMDHNIEKPAIQLVNFEKTQTLYPSSMSGEGKPNSQEFVIKADLKYFASYDETASHDGKIGGYILEDADYYFSFGNGAHEAINNVLINKNSNYENLLYNEKDCNINKDLAIKWNPAQDQDVTSDERGTFNSGINATLLSTSEDGTVIIENQLQDGDYNYFNPNKITYLTRKAWDTTFPKPYIQLEIMDGMKKYLGTSASNGGRVYEFKSGGSSGVEFGVDHSEDEDINGEPLKNKVIAEYKGFAYDDPSWDYLLEQITFDEAWMFSPYGGTSCKPFKSVNAPEVWQIDGPNGNVTRFVGNKAPKTGEMAVPANDPNAEYLSSDMPCEPMIAATFNKELAQEEGRAYGEDCLWSRNGIAWSPGMNLHRTPFNSRNHEYYSEDPMLTNIIGTHFVRGGLEKGMILSAKHFAFNTQESFREGLTQFMEEQSARELELRAYQGLFQDVDYINSNGLEVNALGLMTSFSRIGVCGVNAHTGLMKNILRGEFGFKGLISTDMVVGGRYFNPQDSIINNVTFMATSNAENLLKNFWPEYNDKQKVRNDPNLCKALYENMHYYMYAIANSAALNGMNASTVITEDKMSSWEFALIGSSIGVGVGAVACLSAYIYLCLRKEEKEVE